MQARKQQLVAYLEKGKTYYLVGGSETVMRPQYDLVQFRDSIPDRLDVLHYGELVANTAPLGETNMYSRVWLWPSIILMIGILGLLTVKLMRDMRRKEI